MHLDLYHQYYCRSCLDVEESVQYVSALHFKTAIGFWGLNVCKSGHSSEYATKETSRFYPKLDVVQNHHKLPSRILIGAVSDFTLQF